MQSFPQIVTTVSIINPFPNMRDFQYEQKLLLVSTLDGLKLYELRIDEREGRLSMIDMALELPIEGKVSRII